MMKNLFLQRSAKHSVHLLFALIFFLLFTVGIVCVWAGTQDSAKAFIAHVASFQIETNANNFSRMLEQKGLKAWSKKTTVPGKGEFHRVYVGPYDSRQAALAALQKLKEDHVIAYYYVIEEEKAAPVQNKKSPPKSKEVKKILPGSEPQVKAQEKSSADVSPGFKTKDGAAKPPGADKGTPPDKKILVPEPAEAVADTAEEQAGE